MTRKHFEALALALKQTRPDYSTFPAGAIDQWRADVRAIAEVLLAHNPRLTTRGFYAACGYEIEGAKS